jgi:hypothetical protein
LVVVKERVQEVRGCVRYGLVFFSFFFKFLCTFLFQFMFYLNDEQSSNNFTCSNLLDNMSSWNGKLFVILFHNYNYAIKYALLFKTWKTCCFFMKILNIISYIFYSSIKIKYYILIYIHTHTHTPWAQVICLDLFSAPNGLKQLAWTQHSLSSV